MFKNDERYWDINLLNKWFAISSIVFLITMVWTFIDDNDDEFKDYQREFRKLQIEKAEEKLVEEKSSIEGEVKDYDELLAKAEEDMGRIDNASKYLENIFLFIDTKLSKLVNCPRPIAASKLLNR